MTTALGKILSPTAINRVVSRLSVSRSADIAALFGHSDGPAICPEPVRPVKRPPPLTKADLEDIERRLDDEYPCRSDIDDLLAEVYRLRRLLAKKRKGAN